MNYPAASGRGIRSEIYYLAASGGVLDPLRNKLDTQTKMDDKNSIPPSCPQCGATWEQDLTCQDYFHQMLFWEAENSELGEVHHLMVLAYSLQHPSLYSSQGLENAMGLLVDFLVNGLEPHQVGVNMRAVVDAGKRSWTITARLDSQGSYAHPVHWPVTAAQVVAGGPEAYCQNVRDWAGSILKTLKESGNLS